MVDPTSSKLAPLPMGGQRGFVTELVPNSLRNALTTPPQEDTDLYQSGHLTAAPETKRLSSPSEAWGWLLTNPRPDCSSLRPQHPRPAQHQPHVPSPHHTTGVYACVCTRVRVSDVYGHHPQNCLLASTTCAQCLQHVVQHLRTVPTDYSRVNMHVHSVYKLCPHVYKWCTVSTCMHSVYRRCSRKRIRAQCLQVGVQCLHTCTYTRIHRLPE